MPSQSPAERWAETSLHSWAAADMEGFSIGKKKKIAFDRSALPFVRERRPAGPVQQPQEVNEHFSAGSFISGSEGWECQRSIVPAEKEEKEATLVCHVFVSFLGPRGPLRTPLVPVVVVRNKNSRNLSLFLFLQTLSSRNLSHSTQYTEHWTGSIRGPF